MEEKNKKIAETTGTVIDAVATLVMDTAVSHIVLCAFPKAKGLKKLIVVGSACMATEAVLGTKVKDYATKCIISGMDFAEALLNKHSKEEEPEIEVEAAEA